MMMLGKMQKRSRVVRICWSRAYKERWSIDDIPLHRTQGLGFNPWYRKTKKGGIRKERREKYRWIEEKEDRQNMLYFIRL